MDMIDTQMAEKYIENQIVLSDEKTSSTFKRSAKITEIKMILSTFFSTKKTLTLANIIEAMRIESHAVSKQTLYDSTDFERIVTALHRLFSMRKSQLEQKTAFWEKKRIEVISEMAQVHRITSKKERDTTRMNTAMKIADVYDKVQLVSLEINQVRKQYDAVEELRRILIDKETEKSFLFKLDKKEKIGCTAPV